MRSLSYCFLFLFLPLIICSQTEKDSLLGIYKSGTATSETLNLLAAVHYETSIDSGKFFAQQALEYAKSTDNKAQIGESYYQLGDAAYYSGQTDSVFYFYSKSLEYYHQTDKNNEIAAVYNDIGQVLQMMNYNDSATLYFDLAMDYIEKEVLPEGYYSILINKGTSLYAKGSYALANEAFLRVINLGYYALSAERLAAVYSNLGLSYKRTSNFNQAIFYYQKAFQIDDSLGFQYNKAIDLANIGGVYFTWKQYEEALNYFKRSLEIYESYGKERNISSILSNIAAAQKGLNLLSEAQFNYDRALKLALKINDNYQIASAYHGLGMLAFERSDYQTSIDLEQKAKSFFLLTQRSFGLCNVSLSIARSAVALKKFTLAKEELKEAELYAQSTNSLELKKEVALQKAQYFSAIGESQKSNEYYKQFIRLNDSIFDQNTHRLITEFNIELHSLEQQREMEKISMQNEINESKIANKNVLIIILAVGVFLFILTSSVIFHFYHQKQKSYQLLFDKSQEELKSAQKLDDCKKDMIKADLSNEVLKELLDKLHQKMDEEKVYLQMDLSIHKLAQLMDTNTTYLSKIINEYYKQNFNSYINKYRIRAAQEMMHKETYRKYTIEAIAHECGFKSKSSFNEAFKKISGLTPGYYLQKIDQEA